MLHATDTPGPPQVGGLFQDWVNESLAQINAALEEYTAAEMVAALRHQGYEVTAPSPNPTVEQDVVLLIDVVGIPSQWIVAGEGEEEWVERMMRLSPDKWRRAMDAMERLANRDGALVVDPDLPPDRPLAPDGASS